ncbi:Integrator complex subunit 9 [Rhizophlyctis rosea]|nr:Integrator complex subunit 9 [Rhizophlyctis rosea]
MRRVIDNKLLANADILILNNIKMADVEVQEQLSRMHKEVAETLSNGGNVLFPVHPIGSIYELLRTVRSGMSRAGLTTLPIHFVSPVAKQSLALSNIRSEWMSADKHEKVFKAEMPLEHQNLMDQRLLFVHHDIASVFQHQGPYVVFVGHPLLAGGDVVNVIEQWKTDPNNLMVLTETIDQRTLLSWGQHKEMQMRVMLSTFDLRLTPEEVIGPLWGFVQPNRLVLQAMDDRRHVEIIHTLRNLVTSMQPYQPVRIASPARFERLIVLEKDMKHVDAGQSDGIRQFGLFEGTFDPSSVRLKPNEHTAKHDRKPWQSQEAALRLLNSSLGFTDVRVEDDGLLMAAREEVSIRSSVVHLTGSDVARLKEVNRVLKGE